MLIFQVNLRFQNLRVVATKENVELKPLMTNKSKYRHITLKGSHANVLHGEITRSSAASVQLARLVFLFFT